MKKTKNSNLSPFLHPPFLPSNQLYQNQTLTIMNTPANTPEIASKPRSSFLSRFIVIGSVTSLLAVGLFLGTTPRIKAQAELAAASQEIRDPTVTVASINRTARTQELSLPGDVHAFEQTHIYARADGYLLKWHADIGTKVKAGQVLAEIDTPELDQELNQAKAALAQAQANLNIARSSSSRWQELLKSRATSQQEVDEKISSLAAREADVLAADAAVARFQKLADFKQVRAPFSGTVVRRFVDTGALIRAGSSGSSLFELAQTDTLRVHVNVPQAYLRDISLGSQVKIHVTEYPEREFSGKILRTSGAFDPATRTLLTEIEVPNRDGALFPGIHVEVQLSLAEARPPLVVPSQAVMIRGDGLQIAVMNGTDAVRLQKVQLGRDFGKSVEVTDGLSDGARIVTNPTDTLIDGTKVIVAEATPVAVTGK